MEIAITAIAFVSGMVFSFLIYRQGIKDGQRLRQDKPIEPVIRANKERPPLTEEQKKLNEKLKYINDFEVKGL